MSHDSPHFALFLINASNLAFRLLTTLLFSSINWFISSLCSFLNSYKLLFSPYHSHPLAVTNRSKSNQLTLLIHEFECKVLFSAPVTIFIFCPNDQRLISVLQSHLPKFAIFPLKLLAHPICLHIFQWPSLSSQLNLLMTYIFFVYLCGVLIRILHFLFSLP